MRMTFRNLAACTLLALAISACGGGGGSTTTGPGQTVVPSLTTITLPAPSSNIAINGTVQLTATPLDQFGAAFNTAITWSSSNGTVASVSTTGLVTGLTNGTTVISAQSGSVRNSVTVGVGTGGGSSPLNASVTATESRTFSPGTATIQAGGTVQFIFPGIQHTVTFSTAGAPESIPATSASIVARTFSAAGTYAYECSIHAGMTGTIVVR